MIFATTLHFRWLPLAFALVLAGCLTPLADPSGGGPEVSAVFEVMPGQDQATWYPDAGVDAVADAALDAADDATLTDAETLPDAPTGDAALPGDATLTDLAGGDTATTLPDALTLADAATGTDVSPACGDGNCSKADKENCKVCPVDCGDCPSVCGDGTCQSDETCTDCPGDCGACTPVCAIFGSSGCAALEQCYPDGKANLCGVAGTKSVGDACVYFNECQIGQLCVGGVCRVLCNDTGLDAQWLCEPGVPCDPVNVGGAAAKDLGVCVP